jgi:hypothetical protein
MISRLELVRITTFSGIDPSFTTGKLIGVWNCHAIRRQRITTIFTSILYGISPGFTADKIIMFEVVTRLANIGKRPSSHPSSMGPRGTTSSYLDAD